MQSFMPIHFFVFKIRTIESGFADPKRFREFRETGPSPEFPKNDDKVGIDRVGHTMS